MTRTRDNERAPAPASRKIWAKMDKKRPLYGAHWFIAIGGKWNSERTDLSMNPVLFSGGKWNCVMNGQLLSWQQIKEISLQSMLYFI
jgi:hypothetical protein